MQPIQLRRHIRQVKTLSIEGARRFALTKEVRSKHTGALELRIMGNGGQFLVDNEQDCESIELLRLDYLSKLGTTVFSQIWMEWLVSDPRIESRVPESDHYPPCTNRQLQILAKRYPEFVGYLLELASLAHLSGIGFKSDKTYYYIFDVALLKRLKRERRSAARAR